MILNKLRSISLLLLMAIGTLSSQAQITQEIWGLATAGLFKTDSIGENLEYVYNFKPTDGGKPVGTLVSNEVGKVFGLTSYYGEYDSGILFEYNITTSTYEILHSFQEEDGAKPLGSLLISGFNLYGVTSQGGANGVGVLFSFNYVTGTYTKLHDFESATGSSPNRGALILNEAGKLMGMTLNGGASDLGVIFEYDLDTETYTNLHDFDGTDGSYPINGLLQASNGKIYGQTTQGGVFNHGIIFHWEEGSFTKLFDFNDPIGRNPGGSLIEASNGDLYGTTAAGGVESRGTIFKMDTLTHTHTLIYSFQPDGDPLTAPLYEPLGDLFEHSDGYMYATTNQELGMSIGGGFYRFDPLTEEVISTYSFPEIRNNCFGSFIQGFDGELYFLEPGHLFAEDDDYGSIFRYSPGLGAITTVYSFDILNLQTGYYLWQTSNGVFHGIIDGNRLFTYESATGEVSFSDPLTDEFDLTEVHMTKINGEIVYGSTGDAFNDKIFKLNLITGEFDILHTFTALNGWVAFTHGIASDGNIYGICRSHSDLGGLNTVFKIDPITETYTTELTTGESLGVLSTDQNSTFLEVEPGILVASINTSGIYAYNYLTNEFTQEIDYVVPVTGARAVQLIKASNDKIYGRHVDGGPLGYGVLFEFDYATNTYAIVHEFTDFEFATNGLVQADNGKLYGINSNKKIFEYDYETDIFTWKETLTGSYYQNPLATLVTSYSCSSSYDTLSVESCAPYISVSGNSYTETGLYTDTLTSVNLCGGDSLITVNLSILPTSEGVDTQTACETYTWIDGNTYTESVDDITYTLTNESGCDSVVTLNLTINEATGSTDEYTICNEFTWIDGETYYESNNTATVTLTNAMGCDSIVTLDLTITEEMLVSVSYSGIGALVATAPEAISYQWLDCDNDFEAIPDANEILFIPPSNGNYAVVVSNGSCIDTSACFTVGDVSLDENLENNIRLFPNPTNNIINIQTSFMIDLVEVFTLSGQRIIVQKENQVDLAPFENGTYLFKITTPEGVSLQKVIKN